MARTLLNTAEDLLRHIYAERKALGPPPEFVRTPEEFDLAGKHFRLGALIKDLNFFLDDWVVLTGEKRQPLDPEGAPSEAEIQTAIQSITKGTA